MVREIHIKPVLNGFVCTVGCQTVVVNSINDLVTGIGDYYRNPAATEKKWIGCALNKTMATVPEPISAAGQRAIDTLCPAGADPVGECLRVS